MSRLTKNAAQCARCGDTITSTHVHDFVTCSCRAIAVVGGTDYLRRIGNPQDFIDLSEYAADEPHP